MERIRDFHDYALYKFIYIYILHLHHRKRVFISAFLLYPRRSPSTFVFVPRSWCGIRGMVPVTPILLCSSLSAPFAQLHKLCERPLQYALAPCKTTFDLMTLKVVSESRVTWATSVPILVFLGLCVLDLGPMYAKDRQTDSHQTRIIALMPPTLGAGV